MYDHCYCLCLDKREFERTIDKMWAKWGMPIELYKCGDGKIFPLSYYDYVDHPIGGREQAYNYANCLKNIVTLAKTNGFKNFLFLEDDAEINARYITNFQEILLETLQEFFNASQKWDMLYLGGNIQETTDLRKITENTFQANYLLDMQAVVFNESAYDTILAIDSSNEHTIDGVIGTKIRSGEFLAYTTVPVLVTQKDCFSYNENKWVSRKENHIL